MVQLPTLGALLVYGATQPKWLALRLWFGSARMARSVQMVLLYSHGALPSYGPTPSSLARSSVTVRLSPYGALRLGGATRVIWRALTTWSYSRLLARSPSMVRLIQFWRARHRRCNSYHMARSAVTVLLAAYGSLPSDGPTLFMRRAPGIWSSSALMARSQQLVQLLLCGSLPSLGATPATWRAHRLWCDSWSLARSSKMVLLNVYGSLLSYGATHAAWRARRTRSNSSSMARSWVMVRLSLYGALCKRGPSPR
jgi:hypothetical protein